MLATGPISDGHCRCGTIDYTLQSRQLQHSAAVVLHQFHVLTVWSAASKGTILHVLTFDALIFDVLTLDALPSLKASGQTSDQALIETAACTPIGWLI